MFDVALSLSLSLSLSLLYKAENSPRLYKADGNLKLSHDGPSQRHQTGTNGPINVLGQKVSEYYQEIPQPHTADQPTAP